MIILHQSIHQVKKIMHLNTKNGYDKKNPFANYTLNIFLWQHPINVLFNIHLSLSNEGCVLYKIKNYTKVKRERQKK